VADAELIVLPEALRPSWGEARTLALFPDLVGLDFAAEGDDGTARSTGIFPSQRIEEAIEANWITAQLPVDPAQVQPASLDLRLGDTAHRVRASFLPSKRPVLERLREFTTHELDLTRPAVLERGCVYIVPLMESLQLPHDVWAKANPKSSIGRVDVFTRLITDYGDEFERVAEGYHGRLYLEIVPRTFSILVRAGTRMSQIRFVRGTPIPWDKLLEDLEQHETLVFSEEGAPIAPRISHGLWISVDLAGEEGSRTVGYRAKPHAPLIDLDANGAYEPADFWEPIERPRDGQLILNPGDFYILSSCERIRVPPTVAAEMVGYEPLVGEFRIHYAGFFDPGFGYGHGDVPGTRAVLEVRSHDVPFVLEDHQRAGRLVYERLLAPPAKLYGAEIGSSYQRQGVALSKHFK
jgi:dCTP deaminase